MPPIRNSGRLASYTSPAATALKFTFKIAVEFLNHFDAPDDIRVELLEFLRRTKTAGAVLNRL
jgi:hypothetical protein